MKKYWLLLFLLIPSLACADSSHVSSLVLKDEGSIQGTGTTDSLNCVGTAITCTKSGTAGTLTISSSGGFDQNLNTTDSPSFQNVSVPADPYDATSYNGNLHVMTKDDFRDVIVGFTGANLLTRTAGLISLSTNTDHVANGTTSDFARQSVVGTTDTLQSLVRCNSTNSGACFTVDLSSGTDIFNVLTTGVEVTGNLTVTGTGGSFDVGNGSTGPGKVHWLEDTDNGSNYIEVIGASSLGSNITLTLPTTTGTFALLADPVFTSSVQLPNGANPTTDAAGEVAVDTSATSGAALRFYADAAYELHAWRTKSFTIILPTAADDYILMRSPYATTIKAIHVLCTGGTNIIGGLDEGDSDGANVVAVDSDITGTAGSTAADDGSLTNPTIAAGGTVNWHTTSISGTPTYVTVWMDYTEDQVN